MKKEVVFHYGCTTASLQKQAKDQGLMLDHSVAKALQASADALQYLYYADFVTDAEKNRIATRINRAVFKALRPLDKGNKK